MMLDSVEGYPSSRRRPHARGQEDLMVSAVINLEITAKRMLNKAEGARHCGRSIKAFESECPVSPVQFPNGQLRYDVHDLDAWLDALKTGKATNADDIVAKLE